MERPYKLLDLMTALASLEHQGYCYFRVACAPQWSVFGAPHVHNPICQHRENPLHRKQGTCRSNRALPGGQEAQYF